MVTSVTGVVHGPRLGPDAATDVVGLVVARALAAPHSPAVRDGTTTLTYGRLVERVEALALRLAAAGVGPGTVVGVEVDRSWQEVVAVLAVLRAGAAYTAVDQDAPVRRAHALLAAATPVAVLGTTSRAAELARRCGVPLLDPAAGATPADDRPAGTPLPSLPSLPLAPDSVAYVAFTSGSTGEPKGVQVPHRAVSRLVAGAGEYTLVGPGQVYLRLAPLAFDASTFELFVALGHGARLEVHPPGPVAPLELAEVLATRGVTVAWLTAGLFRAVVEQAPHALDGLSRLLTGGDVVPADRVREVLERTGGRLVVTNGYGPTENTTFSTTFSTDDPADVTDGVPIGRPVAGTSVLVVDDALEPVPEGEVGELLVGGDGLATGYLGRPDLTAAAFVEHPAAGARMYRTGDLVRWEGGHLVFLGRADRQVKVRGHRVELAEVESRLRADPSVRDASAAHGVVGRGPALVAAVVLDGADPAGVRRSLLERAPSSMVPLLVVVERLPLTPNGKVDHEAVLALAARTPDAVDPADAVRGGDDGGEADVDDPADVEDVVAATWATVLGHADFDRDEGFFEVGGDSLSAAELHSRLTDAFPSVGLRVVEVFSHPTVEQLAEVIRARLAAPPPG